MSAHGIRLEKWNQVPRETVTDDISRQLFTGERMMLAHVHLDAGAVVPWHSHENEQLSWILSGALRFHIGHEGTDDVEEVVVSAGEVLFIPSDVPHRAEALEDTLDVDIFCPPREDWLTGTDTYFQDR